ncbi:MAG: hypothetical protein H7145_02520 [Akkermansiaceae bacterium]|nr:hypothetical protein [Armatimonadota bacterium]
MFHFRFDARFAITALTATATVCVASVALVGKPEPVQAFPAFTDKEGVKCAYCHVNAGGGGKRNYRGKFYKKNALSFANFDDKAEATAAGEPIGAEADAKPKSLTVAAGAPAATPEPAVATPAPATPSPQATVSPVVALRKKVAATQLTLKKSPTNPAAKKAHSASLTALGRGVMDDPAIPPVKKYPEALNLFRQAVKLDATNKNAAGDIKRIETVYKQMGKPIPK